MKFELEVIVPAGTYIGLVTTTEGTREELLARDCPVTVRLDNRHLSRLARAALRNSTRRAKAGPARASVDRTDLCTVAVPPSTRVHTVDHDIIRLVGV